MENENAQVNEQPATEQPTTESKVLYLQPGVSGTKLAKKKSTGTSATRTKKQAGKKNVLPKKVGTAKAKKAVLKAAKKNLLPKEKPVKKKATKEKSNLPFKKTLDYKTAMKIRADFAGGGTNVNQLAKKYGKSTWAIKTILTNLTYKPEGEKSPVKKADVKKLLEGSIPKGWTKETLPKDVYTLSI